MSVEVVERAGNWRTLNLAGSKINIMHGMTRMIGPDGGADGSAMPTEYLKSLAALALAGLECDGAVTSPACLFIGLGAGTLPKLVHHHIPGASCVALELDGAVCEAARLHLGLDGTGVQVVIGDGVEWVEAQAAAAVPPKFDAIFIDIFDGQNNCPPAAHSDSFLGAVHALLQPSGVVVHNLHYGSQRLNGTLQAAESAYARTFESACRAFALDAQPWAGNAIIAASPSAATYSAASSHDVNVNRRLLWPHSEPGRPWKGLLAAAAAAGTRHQLIFDLPSRCGGAEDLKDLKQDLRETRTATGVATPTAAETAEMATPRFIANVAEARRLRESLPLGEAGAAVAQVGLLEEELIDGWGAATEELTASLARTLGLRGPLEMLHGELPAFSPDRESHKRITKASLFASFPLAPFLLRLYQLPSSRRGRGKLTCSFACLLLASPNRQAKIELQSPLTDTEIAATFHAAYESLICAHVAPHVASACAAAFTEGSADQPMGHPGQPVNLLRTSEGEETLWYACVPTLRVQTPSEEHATIRPHVDGMYALPDGSLNFWVPLTDLDRSSTLWVESRPGLEDFHPLTGATRFDGRRCLHFTLPNHSPRTRVSLDFRCIPGALYEPNGRLAKAGYFSSVVRTTSASGEQGKFVPACRGQISMLHGLPHTGTPPGWKSKAARQAKR